VQNHFVRYRSGTNLVLFPTFQFLLEGRSAINQRTSALRILDSSLSQGRLPQR
jgi:hypothetical protein